MTQKNKRGKKKPKKEKKNILTTTWMVTLFALLCALLAGFYYRYQLQNYEDGVIEVYAVQQDSYVQMVLDQINLIKDREDAEIIRNILGTMDASLNKYWTMSKDDTLVFVRDITETNRYHGFTDSTYYMSDSAKVFIDNLTVNHVTHQIVQIGDRDYIASGVKFAYNNAEYQICLLTNPAAILDHNAYLSAKINLTIMMGLVLAVFMIMALTLGLWLERMNRSRSLIERENIHLRRTIEKLNAALSRQEMYDARTAVFHSSMLPLFLKKLRQKQTLPVVLARFSFAAEDDREVFLTGSQMVFGRNYLRFGMPDGTLLLIGIRCRKEDAAKAVEMLGAAGCENIDLTGIDRDLDDNLKEYMEKWNIEEEDDEL